MSERLSRIRVMTHSSQGVSRCLTASPGEAVNEAVKQCEVARYQPRHHELSRASTRQQVLRCERSLTGALDPGQIRPGFRFLDGSP